MLSEIGQEKSRAGMIAEGGKVMRFPLADLSGTIEVGGELCSHGITAQHTQKKDVSSIKTCAECEPKERTDWSEEFFDPAGMDQDASEDDKGKQGGDQSIQP